MSKTLKIGTRGSPLALKQTTMVREALAKAHPDLQTEVVEILTSGDWKPEDGEVRLNTAEGGKGQFAKEIEEQLLRGDIDLAVHSMKDMESYLPEGLIIEHMLPREDVRDCLLVHDQAITSFQDLPQGMKIGTASVRRQAFLLSKRPDLNIEPIRGNVGTRIEKLRAGQYDATLLAMAGLKRMGLEAEVDITLEMDEMLPAAGQGAVGIEIRQDDQALYDMLNAIKCEATTLCVSAERAALAVLDGSCHTPIGAYAKLDGETMSLDLCVVALDGSETHNDAMSMEVKSLEDARLLGTTLGHRLKARIPEGLLEQVA